MMGDCALFILADVVKSYNTDVGPSEDLFRCCVLALCDVVQYRCRRAAGVLASDEELLQKLRTIMFAPYEDDSVKAPILKLLTLLVV